MFADLARKDLERLRAEGLSPTDEEVVLLNDLAVDIERGQDTTAVNHPRFANAGDVVLHEPTIAMIEWWWSFGLDAFTAGAWKLRCHYFALAMARTPGVFSKLENSSDIRRAVKAWCRGVTATDDELFRAMVYVKHGERLGDEEEGEKDERPADDVLDGVTVQLMAAAGQSGMKMDDLRLCTRSELFAIIRASLKGGVEMKPSVARKYMKYQSIIRDIRSRKETK